MFALETRHLPGLRKCTTPRPDVPDPATEHSGPLHHTTASTPIYSCPPITRSNSNDVSLSLHRYEEFITPYDPNAIIKVLIPVSVVGWLVFGIICILCINGRGRAGRWIPEWYLDSEGTTRDKAAVVVWWVVVMVLWPVILPVLLVGKVIGAMKRCVDERRQTRRGGEKKAMEDFDALWEV